MSYNKAYIKTLHKNRRSRYLRSQKAQEQIQEQIIEENVQEMINDCIKSFAG
jgi:hypothetical protein